MFYIKIKKKEEEEEEEEKRKRMKMSEDSLKNLKKITTSAGLIITLNRREREKRVIKFI